MAIPLVAVSLWASIVQQVIEIIGKIKKKKPDAPAAGKAPEGAAPPK